MLTTFRAQAIAAPRKTFISVNVEPSGDFAIREDEMVENLCQGEDRSWKRKKHKRPVGWAFNGRYASQKIRSGRASSIRTLTNFAFHASELGGNPSV
jgi:hypothetical protein